MAATKSTSPKAKSTAYDADAIQTLEGLEATDRASLKRFHRAAYGPEHLVVTGAGALEHEGAGHRRDAIDAAVVVDCRCRDPESTSRVLSEVLRSRPISERSR